MNILYVYVVNILLVAICDHKIENENWKRVKKRPSKRRKKKQPKGTNWTSTKAENPEL